MAEQTEFSCVSCETTFDPSPNGGFCPNCNTPHPDYEAPSGDDADSSDEESETADDAADDEDDLEVEYDEGEEAETDDEDEAETDADGEAEDDGDTPEEDEPATIECQSCDSTVDASAAFCPNCGEELEEADESEADESVELTECPDCGNSIDEESFCPSCGTDLDAIRESGGVDADDEEAADEAVDDEIGDDEADDADDETADDDASDDEASDDDADDVPTEVTLEIDGEPYTFGDGDVFGRRDEEWLADLVSASGGREEARYLSGEHLEFAVEDDGVYVTDVSTNGTKRNGTAMDGSEEKLEDGDTLELAGRAEIDVKLS
ncbi:double zinc ribbon domain-containing protein [Natrinema salsiterrestre]|uniref:Zinc ribbon domain-containing protein n=1 Tax=Natrinema salsiterrestre TaxID=2950540 RepID=A0A9Q4KYX9_9EURY|nr:zinc ribbon domain-containing protein [Natrinema salsiterrestre]MDF9744681.1 zinc ribbon domain-containing protein [Natrinema salsiterrestre]